MVEDISCIICQSITLHFSCPKSIELHFILWGFFPQDNNSVVIAKVDCTENQKTCGRFGVRGYPTIKLIRAGKELGEYNGQRTVDGMKEYVNEHAVDEKKAEQEKDEL